MVFTISARADSKPATCPPRLLPPGSVLVPIKHSLLSLFSVRRGDRANIYAPRRERGRVLPEAAEKIAALRSGRT